MAKAGNLAGSSSRRQHPAAPAKPALTPAGPAEPALSHHRSLAAAANFHAMSLSSTNETEESHELANLQCTPIHTRTLTTSRYNPKYEERSGTFLRLSKEMAPFFVGPMPPQVFLENFLSLPSVPSHNLFPSLKSKLSAMAQSSLENEMYNQFIKITKLHLPNLKVVNTSGAVDVAPSNNFPFNCKPDLSVYDRKRSPTAEGLDSSLVEFTIEFKTLPSQDPFRHEKLSPTHANPFINLESKASDTAGQVTSYATLILSSQYRTHVFSILIIRNYARLIRWDCGGAIVTEPIYYAEEPFLLDFLVRYDRASKETRGHDLTVSSPTAQEVQAARTIEGLEEAKSFLAVTIEDPRAAESRRFIICGPRARPDIPVGRWTRTSIAYDVTRKTRVFFKDSWRVLLEGIEPEGDIYEKLRSHAVPSIAHCTLAGDVNDHKSQTHEFAKIYWQCHSAPRFIPHRHYRMVLDTIGRGLMDFKRSRDLISAMYCSLRAHRAACAAGILHRDLSPGNIVILEGQDPGGLLIDWDLSKPIDPAEGPGSARRFARTGTWQFMAGDLVKNPRTPQTTEHDLESAFWVLFWITLSYIKTNYLPETRSCLLKQTMSPRCFVGIGGSDKVNFMINESELDDFSTPDTPLVAKVIRFMHNLLGQRYRKKSLITRDNVFADISPAPRSTAVPDSVVQDYYEKILDVMETALNMEWPDPDPAAELQEFVLSDEEMYAADSGPKRSRVVAEQNGAFLLLPEAKRSPAN